MKKGWKKAWGRHGMWLGAGQAEAMGYEDAGISELPPGVGGRVLWPFSTRIRDAHQGLKLCVRDWSDVLFLNAKNWGAVLKNYH